MGLCTLHTTAAQEKSVTKPIWSVSITQWKEKKEERAKWAAERRKQVGQTALSHCQDTLLRHSFTAADFLLCTDWTLAGINRKLVWFSDWSSYQKEKSATAGALRKWYWRRESLERRVLRVLLQFWLLPLIWPCSSRIDRRTNLLGKQACRLHTQDCRVECTGWPTEVRPW